MLYFAICLSRSNIAPELDYIETRFIEILNAGKTVKLSLTQNIVTDIYIKPGVPNGVATEIPIKQFKSVICPRKGKLPVASNCISELYLLTVEAYNPRFNYTYFKVRRSEQREPY